MLLNRVCVDNRLRRAYPPRRRLLAAHGVRGPTVGREPGRQRVRADRSPRRQEPVSDDVARPPLTLVDQPDLSPISFFNAPTPQVPRVNRDAMFWLWQRLGDDHATWWRESGFEAPEVHHVVAADFSPRTIARRGTLRVNVGRTVETLRTTEDIAALAVGDARAALDAVAARTGRPAPALPTLPADERRARVREIVEASLNG